MSCEIFFVDGIGEFTPLSSLDGLGLGDAKFIFFGNVRNILDLVAASDRSGVELM